MNFSEQIDLSSETTPEYPRKPEGHTSIQTRNLKEPIQIKKKRILSPQVSTECQTKLLKRYDWANTLLTETEKQAIEDILVDFHYIFARHRMDIRMNTTFNLKLTPKNVKAV